MQTLTTFADLVALVAQTEQSGQPVFVRWSRGPQLDCRAGWVSRNHQTGQAEAGLSVNSVTDVKYGVLTTTPARIAQQVTEYSYLRLGTTSIQPWLLTGTICGWGSDGEPLVCDVQPVAWIAEPAVVEAQHEAARQPCTCQNCRNPQLGRPCRWVL